MILFLAYRYDFLNLWSFISCCILRVIKTGRIYKLNTVVLYIKKYTKQYLVGTVYSKEPNKIPEIKDEINYVINGIPQELNRKVLANFMLPCSRRFMNERKCVGSNVVVI